MSRIKNEPKNKIKLIQRIREQLEQRAIWLALLKEEAKEKGLDYDEFGTKSVTACGALQGATLSQGSNSFKDLKKRLFSKGARIIFEMDLLSFDDDHLSLDFHYCPLVKGWQRLGLTDEQISNLCDTAMCGDHEIARKFGGELELGKVIAKGDDICELRFVKKRTASK